MGTCTADKQILNAAVKKPVVRAPKPTYDVAVASGTLQGLLKARTM